MVAKFVVFALLFIACSYASPLRVATMYSPLFVPVFIQDLDESQGTLDEEPVYTLNDDPKIMENPVNSVDIEKRSIEKTMTDNDGDDLETAAGTNVLRPLFVYRQQVAYRQRVKDAIRRGRRI